MGSKPSDVTILASTQYDLTAEQRIIIAAARRGESFAVRAFAGAGKTSTLRSIGTELVDKRVLYLAFNRDIVREGRAVFPNSVKVATGHAFARRVLSRRYGGKIDDTVPTLDARIRDRLALPSRRGEVTDAHEALSERIAEQFRRFCYDTSLVFEPAGELEATQHARAIWSHIQTTRAINPADHDLYAKLLYVLQVENEHPKLGFDVILYDECQDCTGSMFGIVRGQRATQQIYMGDPAQAIYAFRGATNAFSFLDDLTAYSLTTSFRFGPHIAALAEQILRAAGPHHPIRVLPQRTDRVVISHDACPQADVILTRSQHQVIDAALGEFTRGRKVAIVGTLEGSRLQSLAALATDVYALREGRSTPRLAKFASFQTLKWYAETKNAAQLRIAVGLVERFGDRVSELLDTLRAQVVLQEEADVIVSTAHAFKGRQAARVTIAGDFRPFASRDKERASTDLDEVRLAYVAVTRAQRVLDITDFREPLIASLIAVGAHASLSGIVEEHKRMQTGMTKAPRALARLIGNAGNLHAPEATIRVAIPSAKARARQEIAAVSARLTALHRKSLAETPHSEFAGTFLEALALSPSAGVAFIEGTQHIGVIPIDGSTVRSANVLRGKRVIAREVHADEPWALRVTLH